MTETTPSGPELGTVEVHGVNRATFILRGALAAGATLGVGAVGPFVSSAFAADATSDIDILNFALTLEYLETNFYQVKAKSLSLSAETKAVAASFGAEEAEHVSALTAAIKAGGGKPVAMPTFDFPVTSEKTFLALAYTVENVGVGAYNGAGPSLKSKALLAAAGSIVQVEARHAATLGLLTDQSVVPNGGFDKPMTKAQVLKAAGPLIK
jgi:rubrerythrin